MKRFEWIVERLVRLCGYVCEGALCVLVAIVAAEVLSRTFFGVSFSGVEILGAYTLVVMTFVGGAVAVARGAVYSMSLLDDLVGGRIAAMAALFGNAASIALLSIMVKYSVELTQSSYNRGVVFQANRSIELWILQLAIPVGLSMMIVFLASASVPRIRTLIDGKAEHQLTHNMTESGE